MSLFDWQTQLSQMMLLPDAPLQCELSALHGVDAQRLALYVDFMFNTALEMLQNIYPYTYRLLSRSGETEDAWRALVEQYRRAYPNQSHRLMDAASSFPTFLSEQAELIQTHPFIVDLAYYEWLEMVIANFPDHGFELDLPQALPPMAQLADYYPVWNPAGQLTSFRFHVPEILERFNGENALPDSQAVHPCAVDILIYRDPQTMGARFFCVNELTALLMQLSRDERCSYYAALAQLQASSPILQQMPLETIVQQATDLFASCLNAGILLGSQRIPPSLTHEGDTTP